MWVYFSKNSTGRQPARVRMPRFITIAGHKLTFLRVSRLVTCAAKSSADVHDMSKTSLLCILIRKRSNFDSTKIKMFSVC